MKMLQTAEWADIYPANKYIPTFVHRQNFMCVCRKFSLWKKLEFGEKVFFEDLGIRNSIVGYRPNDIGGLMENAVHNHLAASDYNVKVGVGTQGHEVDFIAEKDNEYRYVRVALSVMDDETAGREFGNLARIPDNYEKTVVTYADSAPNTNQGIRQMSLREFLLS